MTSLVSADVFEVRRERIKHLTAQWVSQDSKRTVVFVGNIAC